jgi:lantibiotic leader peptide-processing serine protease
VTIPPIRGLATRAAVIATAITMVLAVSAVASAASAAAASSGTESTYVVLYQAGASSSNAAADVRAAEGTLVANYQQIGVVIARSSSSTFVGAIKGAAGVAGAAATDRFAVPIEDATEAGPLPGSAPATDSDNLSGLQWDMRQINAPQAHAITGGSRQVVVGDVDTGLDFTHPDIAPNFNAAKSTDCSSGTPQPLLPGNDRNGHGTHTAGTIAAASNGTGIVGVAPNVSIAGIKSSNDDGFFFPEMVICSYLWVATHGIDVTNNSYFADPWLFNCRNDAEQRTIWNAERRAIGFAQSRGTVVVASEGNNATDLSHPTVDTISPDFPPNSEVERNITNACAVVPVEVPGVVGVTATGDLSLKAYYSSYGISTADVAAPGGDRRLQVTPEAPNGRVLSTWPAADPCALQVTDPTTGAKYCYLQGTSMAGPHVAGVAALIRSQHGTLTSGGVAAAVQKATNPRPCPDTSIYAPFPQLDGSPQTCQGSTAYNSFYGSGEIDALKAVS